MTTEILDAPAATGTEIALIDLSSIAYPIWHMSAGEPDPDAVSTKIVDRIRALTSQHPHAAICCDSGKSFRADIDPAYKANRPERDATLHHQIAKAVEVLRGDGFPIWAARGFEADDVIATATAKALQVPDTSVLIISADKDLLQLVGPRVRAKGATTGLIADAAVVKEKFGVEPSQMRDYLALVGDKSDNITGAASIGPVKAAQILTLFGTLDDALSAVHRGDAALPPSTLASLKDFRARADTVRELISLRVDVDLPFEEIAAERTPKAPPIVEEEMPETDVIDVPPPAPQSAAPQADKPVASTALAVQAADLAPAPADFERQLDPRSLPQAMQLANHMHAARMFNGYGSPQAVLSTILAGRELGLTAIASLRAFHVIEGKHSLAADAMRALALRSGKAKYFRCVERTPEKATFETLRDGDPAPTSLTFTIQDGRGAFVGDDAKWSKSSWAKHPADMLAARASSKLARLVYADILYGLYSPEELGE